MGVDVKALFEELGIAFRERGRNVGRGNIVISCPFCGDDPSMHLSVNFTTGAYYCWRDPRHCGGDPFYILRQLRIPRERASEVVALHKTATTETRERKERTAPNFDWNRFEPALSDRHLRYLASRGFDDPAAAVRLGDLRCSDLGEARWRILFPLFDGEHVRGWTGRAMHKEMSPKYQTECDDASLCIVGNTYAPTLLAVEGPIDALKANYAILQGGIAGISAFAFLGKKLSIGRVEMLMRAAPERVVVCVDSDAIAWRNVVAAEGANTITFNDLKMFTRLDLAVLPEEAKDIGEMPVANVQTWIKELLS